MEDTTFKISSATDGYSIASYSLRPLAAEVFSNPYDILNKFGLGVVILARTIPEIGNILDELNNARVPVRAREGKGAEYSQYNRLITLGTDHSYIDILGALVHEYTHWKNLIKPLEELFTTMSKEEYIEYMIQQELIAYTEQARFLNTHAGFNTEWAAVVVEYRTGNVDHYVRNFKCLGETQPHHQTYFSNNYDSSVNFYKDRGYAVTNKV